MSHSRSMTPSYALTCTRATSQQLGWDWFARRGLDGGEYVQTESLCRIREPTGLRWTRRAASSLRQTRAIRGTRPAVGVRGGRTVSVFDARLARHRRHRHAARRRGGGGGCVWDLRSNRGGSRSGRLEIIHFGGLTARGRCARTSRRNRAGRSVRPREAAGGAHHTPTGRHRTRNGQVFSPRYAAVRRERERSERGRVSFRGSVLAGQAAEAMDR